MKLKNKGTYSDNVIHKIGYGLKRCVRCIAGDIVLPSQHQSRMRTSRLLHLAHHPTKANTPQSVDSIVLSQIKPPLDSLEVVQDLLLSSVCPFAGMFELDYQEGVSVTAGVTYNNVF